MERVRGEDSRQSERRNGGAEASCQMSNHSFNSLAEPGPH